MINAKIPGWTVSGGPEPAVKTPPPTPSSGPTPSASSFTNSSFNAGNKKSLDARSAPLNPGRYGEPYATEKISKSIPSPLDPGHYREPHGTSRPVTPPLSPNVSAPPSPLDPGRGALMGVSSPETRRALTSPLTSPDAGQRLPVGVSSPQTIGAFPVVSSPEARQVPAPVLSPQIPQTFTAPLSSPDTGQVPSPPQIPRTFTAPLSSPDAGQVLSPQIPRTFTDPLSSPDTRHQVPSPQIPRTFTDPLSSPDAGQVPSPPQIPRTFTAPLSSPDAGQVPSPPQIPRTFTAPLSSPDAGQVPSRQIPQTFTAPLSNHDARQVPHPQIPQTFTAPLSSPDARHQVPPPTPPRQASPAEPISGHHMQFPQVRIYPIPSDSGIQNQPPGAQGAVVPQHFRSKVSFNVVPQERSPRKSIPPVPPPTVFGDKDSPSLPSVSWPNKGGPDAPANRAEYYATRSPRGRDNTLESKAMQGIPPVQTPLVQITPPQNSIPPPIPKPPGTDSPHQPFQNPFSKAANFSSPLQPRLLRRSALRPKQDCSPSKRRKSSINAKTASRSLTHSRSLTQSQAMSADWSGGGWTEWDGEWDGEWEEGDWTEREESTHPRRSSRKWSRHSGSQSPGESVMGGAWEDFIRPTFYRLPSSTVLQSYLNLPVGFVIQPLAPLLEGETDVTVIDQQTPIARCNRCKAYISPYAEFIENGSKWICNFCESAVEVPPAYYCGLDFDGRRFDREQRPELNQCTVEYEAPNDYSYAISPPAFVFVIDVSASSVKTSFLHYVTMTIDKVFKSLDLLPDTRIGIITYDSTVHVYDLKLENAPMIVMSDVEDPFSPIDTDNALIEAVEFGDNFLFLLNRILGMFQNTEIRDTCMSSAVLVAHKLMEGTGGGKMIIFSAQMSVLGPPDLRQDPKRHQPSWINTDKESNLLAPTDNAYNLLAQCLAKDSISVCIFCGAQSGCDLASVAPLTSLTGGQLYYYEQFNVRHHAKKLHGDFFHLMKRPNGWEGALRVRVSKGWRVKKYGGHFCLSDGLLLFPNCHEYQTFSLNLELEQPTAPSENSYVQVALLYTNAQMARRIRVHTWWSPVVDSLLEILQGADTETIIGLITHNAIYNALGNISTGRRFIEEISRQVVVLQKHFPGCLSLLTVDLLGMLKSEAFRNSVTADQRIYLWGRLLCVAVPLITDFFYPRLLCITDVPADIMEYEECNLPGLPQMMNLSRDHIENHHCYLIENGCYIYIWIGSAVPESTLQECFGISHINEITDDLSGMFTYNVAVWKGRMDLPPTLKNMVMLINVLREERLPETMWLELCPQGSQNEHLFMNELVEEAWTPGYPISYMKFMELIGEEGAQDPSRKFSV